MSGTLHAQEHPQDGAPVLPQAQAPATVLDAPDAPDESRATSDVSKKPCKLSLLTAGGIGLGFFGVSYAAGMAGISYLAAPAQLATYGFSSLAALLISNPVAQVIAGSILAAFAFALLAVAIAAVCNLVMARMNAKEVDAPDLTRQPISA